jgi:hypothetical protein
MKAEQIAERISRVWNAPVGLADAVEQLLSTWQPRTLKTESAYSAALADYLREALPQDVRVEREYRHEGTTADLCVLRSGFLADDRLLFEVKRSLRKKADYDRLVGQIEGLKPKKNTIFIVLVGETDPALLGRLRDHCKDYLESWSGVLRIVVVN